MDDKFYDRVDQITMAESIAVGHIPPIAALEFALGVVLDDGDPDDSERPLPYVSIPLPLDAETVERAIVDAATALLPAVTSEGLRPCALAVDVAGPITNGDEYIACVLIMNMRGLIEGVAYGLETGDMRFLSEREVIPPEFAEGLRAALPMLQEYGQGRF
ncbi:hypothetical protein ACIRRA_42800 [Nocardia sp. NPDC101769]|uniref:hypothetical protein n=1 Tax=Nocardia sp. NPDC101769 TaxID=3364333 RepID=UPI00380D0B2D